MFMLRCLRVLIFLGLLIAFPVGLLVLLWWWLKQQGEYPATLMGGGVAEVPLPETPTAIEIPEAALKSPPLDSVPPAGVVTVVETTRVSEYFSVPVAEEEIAVEVEAVADVEAAVDAEDEVVSEAIVPDNLKRIEGVGPKVAGLLQDAGILTFTQLAETDIAALREILKAARLTFLNPQTWSEQAALAAIEDWAALEKLQDELKGGRRA